MMFDCSYFHLGHVTLKEVEMQVNDIYKITEVSDMYFTHMCTYTHTHTHTHYSSMVVWYMCCAV